MPYKDKERQKQFQADWHLKTKVDRKDLTSKAKKALIKRNQALIASERSGGCKVCGYNKCPEALEFHHKDPNTKDLSICKGVRNWGTDRLREEISKCIVVCANCHREIHRSQPALIRS